MRLQPDAVVWRRVLTDFSGLFNVESVSDEGQIWVDETHEAGDSHLKCISWVEQKLDPARHDMVKIGK